MAKREFVCFFTSLLLLLLMIHVVTINEGASQVPQPIPRELDFHNKSGGDLVSEGEDFQLLSIPGEKEDDAGHWEVSIPFFNPPLSDNPIFSLAAVASQSPPSPPNSSCTLPPILLESLCKDPAFTGQLLQRRRKIVHVVLFGFEVSLLIKYY